MQPRPNKKEANLGGGFDGWADFKRMVKRSQDGKRAHPEERREAVTYIMGKGLVKPRKA